jgi:hypothetical protein
MIGYFVKSGDIDIGHLFSPYCFSFSDLIKEKITGKNYSKDLNLILIEYHLEGRFLELPSEKYKVKSYSTKDLAVAVVIGVPNLFSTWSDSEKKFLIVNTTLEAINLVKNKLSKRRNFDLEGMDRLYTDIKEYSKVFQGKFLQRTSLDSINYR